MRLHARIFKFQADGNLHFVQAVETIEDAKARVEELAERRPGESQ